MPCCGSRRARWPEIRGGSHRPAAVDHPGLPPYTRPLDRKNPVMKIRNSLKSLKGRHRDNRVIRRRGRTYVINKTNRRFKARQG